MAIKKNRGGKYAKIIGGTGYWGNNTAGIQHYPNPNEAGIKREFIGSGEQVFVFYSETRGYLTIRANSFEEAWRLAKARGYSRRNYRR